MYACIVVFFLVMSVLSFVNFGYEAIDQFELGKSAISIEKPQDITNVQFLTAIQECMACIDEDIMYRYIDLSGEKTIYEYYKTNNTNDFLDIKTSNDSIKLDINENISNDYNNASSVLYSSNLFQIISVYDLSKATKYDLSKAIYYVDEDSVLSVAEYLTQQGYSISVFEGEYFSEKLYLQIYIIYFSLIIVVSMIFYFSSEGKNVLIKKLDGYNNFNIICLEVGRFVMHLLLIMLFFVCSNLLITLFIKNIVSLMYIEYFMGYLFFAFALCIGLFLIASLFSLKMSNIDYLKGKVKKKSIYFISIGLKFVFIAVAMFILSFLVEGIQTGYYAILSKESLVGKCENYVTFPINESQGTSDGLENNYYAFYMRTVNEYNGILVDASNYQIDLLDGTNLAETQNQDYINVNSNYLVFNEIHDVDGKIITPQYLSKDKYNVLIPQCKQNEKEKYTQWIRQWYQREVNFITYKDDELIYIYNAEVSLNSEGSIENPVILIFDVELEKDYLLSYFSKMSYFIEATTDEPYKEFYGLLKECGIEKVTLETPYIASNYDEYFKDILYMVSFYVVHVIVLLLSAMILLFFASKTFVENQKENIVFCRLEGYSIFECCKDYFLINIFIYSLIIFINSKMLIILPVKLKVEVFFITIIVEFILTYILLQKEIGRRMLDVMKGD